MTADERCVICFPAAISVVFHGAFNLFLLLKQTGACTSCKNCEDNTALDCAKKHDKFDVVKILTGECNYQDGTY